ncbi:MAG: carbon storage regulator [Firmicutes bacterium]|nr:carbon storage regulator [Bacillota bacterium]
MLLLKRKTGESLVLDGKIKITVVASGIEGVKLAIDAPREVSVLREELIEAVSANKEAAVGKEQVLHLKEILKKKEGEKAHGSDK